MWSTFKVLTIGAAVRVFLIFYGEIQDSILKVRYTDIDYTVFTDAAQFVLNGESPYNRDTYRYTPLIAYAMVPNLFLHPAWGKILFSAADILVGWLIFSVVSQRGCTKELATSCAGMWLFNPFTLPIATRGNCEALVSALILGVIHCLMNQRLFTAAVIFGFAVHFRLYPIIYALPLVLFLDEHYPHGEGRAPPAGSRAGGRVILSSSTRSRVVFTAVSAAVFLACGVVFYLLYGENFLHQAYLYHATRSDPRHNFSIQFLGIYLNHLAPATLVDKLVGFIPQVTVLGVISWVYSRDLPFCLFLETLAFVAFNKVCTAQYFVWFFALLPLIVPSMRRPSKEQSLQTYPPVVAFLTWGAAQIHWLAWAYLLEFQGFQVFIPLWGASIAFFIANVTLLVVLVREYRFSPIFHKTKIFKAI